MGKVAGRDVPAVAVGGGGGGGGGGGVTASPGGVAALGVGGTGDDEAEAGAYTRLLSAQRHQSLSNSWDVSNDFSDKGD